MASLLAGSSVVEVSGTDKKMKRVTGAKSLMAFTPPPEPRRLLAIAITPR
ncbi:hypothetical protein ABR759_05235 [Escherichia coli]